MANNRINYSIGFNVDKTALNQIKTSLQEIKQMTATDVMKIGGHQDIQRAQAELTSLKTSIGQVEGALDRAFNTDLGTLNIAKFNQELKNINLNKVQQDFAKAGSAGQSAFRNLTTQILTTNTRLKETHTLLDNMANTMANTIKWGAASSIMNSFTGSVQQAYGYVKSLDTSLNNIRIVTEKSSEEMARFAKEANSAAKNLGQTTTNYTDAALIYYQQGLNDKEVAARAETTLKAANVTAQTGAEVSEQLTSVWNGYKVTAQETELYVDKLAAVAATTASDLEELSTGMSKVASAAAASGVDIDQLSATLSTVISVTRQAPETVGTAFKTIYARLGDLAVDGEDEFGTKLGEVSSKLKTMGIDILDSQGQMRDMGTVVEEVAAKWETWTTAQKQAAAVAMAGKRQYNNLIALFDNWEMYESSLTTAAGAAGTLQKQQDIYMESTAAHLKELKAASEDVYDSLLDTKGINTLVDGITLAVNGIANLVDAVGGSTGVLLGLGSVGMKVFNKQIVAGITTTIRNLKTAREETLKYTAEMALLQQFKGINLNDGKAKELISMKEEELKYSQILTAEEKNRSNEYIKQKNLLFEEAEQLRNQLTSAQALNQQLSGTKYNVDTDQGRKNTLEDLSASEQEFDSKAAGYTKTTKKLAEYTNAIKESNLELKKQGLTSEQIIAAQEKLEAAYRDQDHALELLIEDGRELLQSDQLQAEERQRLANAIEQYDNAVEKSGSKSTKNTSVLNAAKTAQEAYKNAIDKTSGKIKQAMGDLQSYDERIKNNQKNVETLTASWKNFIAQIDLKSKVQQVVTFSSHISSLFMAISSLQSIGRIWDDDSLTAGQKMTQTILSMSMAVTGLVEGYKALKMIIPALQAAYAGLAGMITLVNVAEGANIAEKIIAIAIEVRYQRAIANSNRELDESAKKKIKDTIATRVRAKAEAEGTKGVLKNILQTKAKDSAVAKLILTLGKYATKLGVIGAILGVVGVGLYAVYQEITRNERAFNDATESAERQLTILNRLKEEHKNLQDTIEGYEDAYNSINNLTKGTEEYAAAVETANNKARELIETLGLYGDWSYDENGVIQLDEAAVQEAYDQRTKEVANSEVAYQSTQYKINRAEWNLEKENRAFDTSIHYQGDGNSQVGSNKDSNMKALANLTDEAFLEIQNLTTLTGKEYAEVFEKIKKETGLAGTEISNLAKIINGLGDEAAVTKDKVEQLVEQEDYQLQQIAKAAAEAQGLFGDNDIANNAYANLLAQDKGFQQANQKNAKLTSGDVDNRDFWKLLKEREGGNTWGMTMNDEELSEIYAKYVEQWSDDEIKKAKYDKGKGEGTLTSGDKTFTVDDETMRQEIYAALLAQNLTEGKDSQGNKAYDDQAIKDIVNGVLNSGVSQLTQDAVLTAMSNYSAETGEMDLDMSLIHPNDVEALKQEAARIGGELGNAMTSELENYDPEKYNERLEEQQSQNIDNQATAEGLDLGNISTQTELIQENTEALAENENAAKQLAVNNTLMNQGMSDLIDNWDDWSKVLKKGDKTTSDYAETIGEVSKCIEDLVGLSDGMGENLSASFFDSAANLELLEKAAQGSEEAVEELGYAAAKDLAENMEFDTTGFDDMITAAQEADEAFKGITLGDGTIVSSAEQMATQFEAAKENVVAGIEQIKNAELGVGDSLSNALSPEDVASFVDSLNTMAIATGMSVQEMQGILNSMGLQATVTTTPVPTTYQVPRMRTEEQIINDGSDGNPIIKESKTWQVGTDEEQGVMDVAQISYDGNTPGAAPITKVGHGKPSSSNKSKGSGGGGGGSTPKKTHKKSDKQFDRYRKVNNELEKLSTQIERLADAEDRLFGKDLLDNLNKQLKVIKQQVVQTKKKLAIAKAEAKEMRTAKKTNEKDENGYKVKNTFADFGIKFDKDTKEITNYKSKMQWYDNEIEKLEKRWNNMTAEQQEDNESLSNRIDALKNNRDTLEELVADYDELIYEKIPELQDEITEAAYTQIEIKLKAFKVEAELYLDMSEALSDLKDFKDQLIDAMSYSDLKYNGKDETGAYNETNARAQQNKLTAAAAMEALTGNKYGKYGNRVTTSNKKGEWAVSDKKNEAYFLKHDDDGKLRNDNNAVARNAAALQKMNNAYAAYTADPKKFLNDPANAKWTATDANGNKVFNEQAFRDEMEKTRDDLQAEIEKVDQMFDDVRTSLLDTIELMGESYDQQLETFDFINSQIERKLDAAKLLNGESDYEGLKDAYKEAVDNAAAKEATAKEAMVLYESKMNSAATEEEREKWRELYQKSVEDYQDANAAAIEALQAQRENTIRAQAEKMFGSEADFGKAEAEWEIQQKLDDKYLDDVDKAYEIQKLTNKLNKDMNDASLAAQSKLAKFREDELKKLKEKDKLTAADVERANKLYEIELKKIALEEAQNNKSQMRLRRDSSGNYSYQFTADENKSAEAQQELDDAQYNLREFDLEQERLAQEELLNLKKEYKEKWIEYQLLSEAEQKARAEEWKAYQEYYNAEITQSALTAIETKANATASSYQLSANLYAQDHTTFTTLNDEQKRLLEEKHASFDTMTMEEIGLIRDTMTPTWTDSMETMIAGVTGQDGLEIAWSNATDKIATKAYDTEGKLQTDWKTAMDMIINGNVGKGGIVTEWTTQTGEIQTSLSTAADGMSGVWKETMKGIAAGNVAEDGIVSAWTGQTVTMKDSWETQLGLMAGQYDHSKKNTFAYKVKDGNTQIITDVGAIDTKIKDLATSMDTTATDAAKYAKETWLPELQNVTTETGDILKDLEDMQQALLDQKPYWDDLKEWASGVADKTSQILADTAAIEAASTTTTTRRTTPTTTTRRVTTTVNKGPQGNGKLNAGDQVTINSSYATSAGGRYISNPAYKPGSKLYIQDVPGYGITETVNGVVWVHVGTTKTFNKNKSVGWIKKKDVSGYDTGGYTGEWTGNEGKMAFLHSKELVLNKKDTENILNAVELVRDLQQSQSAGFAGALEKIFETVLSAMDDRFDKILKQEREHQNKLISNHNNSNNIQQTITIQADFPNAENVKAIEEALNTLVNQATQRAYTTLK